jgi:hypothetical protein
VTRAPAVAEPLFVVGAERSGSTLLKLMLDHHPAISCPHQFEFAVEHVGDDGAWPDLPAYWRILERDGVFQRSRFTIDRRLDYPSLQDHFLRERSRGRPVLGGTLHRHFLRLLLLWPDVRLIHLVRDPRAVARSCVEMGWAGNVWEGAARWIDAEREWDRVCARVPAARRHEVRYEELVADPERVLRGICAFARVDYDPTMLRYPEDSTYGALDRAPLERWRTALSGREQALVDGRAGALLSERGYPSCGFPARRPGQLERAWLGLDDRLGRIRFAVRRQGLGLYMSHRLARWLRMASWERSTARRLRAVAERYIK